MVLALNRCSVSLHTLSQFTGLLMGRGSEITGAWVGCPPPLVPEQELLAGGPPTTMVTHSWASLYARRWYFGRAGLRSLHIICPWTQSSPGQGQSLGSAGLQGTGVLKHN
jgi:hypothetical protein